MVGRSRRSSGPAEYLTSEAAHLEAKNLELAKALADVKNLYKQALDERNYFQKKLFTATLRIRKLENYLNNIDGAAREVLTSVVVLSDHTSDILRNISSSKRLSNIDQSINVSSSNSKASKNSIENKMQVVKPMISGHVILRPTINLRRVNEISLEEMESIQAGNNSQRISGGESAVQNNSTNNDSFQRLSNARNQRVSDRQYIEETEDHEENDDELDESMHSSDGQMEINNHLNSIEEERDSEIESDSPSRTRRFSSSSNRSGGAALTLPSTSSQIPLLSGVFKDVRVYLSPVDPHCNITKIRGSNKAHLKRSSETQTSILRANLSNNSLTDNFDTPERDPNENSMRLSNELRTNSGLNTPRQGTMYNENETLQNLANDYDIDSGGSSRNIDVNNKSKRWLESNKRHTEYISNPKKLHFARTARSTNGNALLNEDYDPLEGPSNLLDSHNSNKLETLCGLGLTPVSDISLSSSSPSSPVLKLRRRRITKLKIEEECTPKRRSSSLVTKRKSSSSSSPLRSVLKLPRRRITKLKIEEECTPKQRSNSHITKRKSSKAKTKRSTVLVSPVVISSPKKRKMLSISPRKTAKHNKRTRTRLQVLNDSSQSSTPSTGSMPTSSPPRKKNLPIKSERIKRSSSKVSLKEPSLRNKLRRSK